MHSLEMVLNSRKTASKISVILVDFENFENFEIQYFELRSVCFSSTSSRMRRAVHGTHAVQLGREASSWHANKSRQNLKILVGEKPRF